MTIEGIKLFQSQIASLCEETAVLQAHASEPDFNDHEISDIESNVRALKKLRQWAQDLPLNEYLLSMVEMTDHQAPMWWLMQARNRFRVMAVVLEKRPPGNLPLAKRIEALADRVFEAKKQLLSSIEALNGPIPLPQWPIVCLSPAQVMATLRVKLHPWFVDGPYPVLQHDENRRILYHPYRMSRCIYGLTASLNHLQERGRTKVSCAQTSSCFEIVLLREGLHLRPEACQAFLDDARSDIVEPLYEMGGETEPLT